jgi:hydrogenase maturation protease
MAGDVKQVLLFGYGNPGRLDDGLGPALAEEVEKLSLPGVKVDSDYQLTVEDAAEVAKYEIVIFADASVNCAEPFEFKPLESKAELSFSSHSVEPGAVMALAEELFGCLAKCFILGIRGYEFNEFGERLSEKARANLLAAVGFIENKIRTGNFD